MLCFGLWVCSTAVINKPNRDVLIQTEQAKRDGLREGQRMIDQMDKEGCADKEPHSHSVISVGIHRLTDPLWHRHTIRLKHLTAIRSGGFTVWQLNVTLQNPGQNLCSSVKQLSRSAAETIISIWTFMIDISNQPLSYVDLLVLTNEVLEGFGVCRKRGGRTKLTKASRFTNLSHYAVISENS